MIARVVSRRPAEGGGLAVLVVVTVLAWLAAPHARTLREVAIGGQPTAPPAAQAPSPRAAGAVAFALAQRGKPYRWGAEGPGAYDCSGLTWAAWRAAGVTIPRTAAGQLADLPRVRGRLWPGDLVVYRTSGPTQRHVALVVGRGRMIEAPGRGFAVRQVRLRDGFMGAVRPGGRG